ncbi:MULTISPECIES: TetR/AcrR family transcriptional regulator [unclassified Mesorhizobium]|uniref:TetR/AcrR family transcriptional regulator n=1 Tax=unclassified Mesorhizobium TaxID=325217 RepID=UPI000FDAC0A1|nr:MULTISPECIES: TetR/AcrR family transcriptional regulator [unclassified Mesorhizobium]TGQ08570.1 TetR/AcrR family transcriptional regulator [Mesorhizobium sp. M2E.F.Ca.ET.219.01.1.1]TGT69106.1 TetR/AcrR family transcriptional regulator [Mesorhizobium sp. M2E.F.Ca.ET.166.01.1.1]TGW01440.1 TetR/AcrR family transcriptional regulator [Mesorhizobium sp. M2E.F.Ca.ET.154.01.1.1]
MNVNPHPRTAQKRRTRKAIVDAAIALLARGETPTVNDVAAAAEVSRRTVYLYFPSFDQLLLDATVGALSQASVDRAIEQATDDGEARVEHLVRALHHVSPEVERLGRSLIRLTVDGAPAGQGVPRRGYRRIEWIEQALSPLRDRLEPDRWNRLVRALAMVIGWEALIVQRDICALSAAEGEDLSVWAANALVKAALEEEQKAGAGSGRRKNKDRLAK